MVNQHDGVVELSFGSRFILLTTVRHRINTLGLPSRGKIQRKIWSNRQSVRNRVGIFRPWNLKVRGYRSATKREERRIGTGKREGRQLSLVRFNEVRLGRRGDGELNQNPLARHPGDINGSKFHGARKAKIKTFIELQFRHVIGGNIHRHRQFMIQRIGS